jgi:hypothetical protein
LDPLTRNEILDLHQHRTILTRVSHPLRLLQRLCHKVRSIFHDHSRETSGLAHGLVHCQHPVHRLILAHQDPMLTLPQLSIRTFRTLTVTRRRPDSAHDVLHISYSTIILFSPFEYCFHSFDFPLFVVYYPALIYLCDDNVSHHSRYTLA